MTTPQRALELADLLNKYAAHARAGGILGGGFELYEEIEQVMRHYAEIMQAEPVAEVIPLSGDHGGEQILVFADIDDWGIGTKLIIKPVTLFGCGACVDACAKSSCMVTADSPPCGGCGNKDPAARCIGCMHQFTPAP